MMAPVQQNSRMKVNCKNVNCDKKLIFVHHNNYDSLNVFLMPFQYESELSKSQSEVKKCLHVKSSYPKEKRTL